MAEKEKQLKVGNRVCNSFGRKGTVVSLGRYGAVTVKWDGGRQEIAESSTLEK
ncbi:hypothetical protein ES703_29849 [subsurface metagenome]